MKNGQLSFRGFATYTLVLLLGAGLFTACKKDTAAPVRIPAAGLMVLNLAPDQPAVNIALSGSLLPGGPLRYTSNNGFYQPVYTGNRGVDVYDFARDSSLSQSSFTFEDSTEYSLFVVGNGGHYQSIVVKDNLDSAASPDKAFIRYINAIPDSSAPVVRISAQGSDLTNSPARFGAVSSFQPVAPGDVAISINNGNHFAATRTVTLEKGKVYTALLIGDPAATDSLRKVQIRYAINGAVPEAENK